MDKVEKYIEDYTMNCSNEMWFEDGTKAHMYEPWLTPDHARAVAKIAREEVIEKAVEWLTDNFYVPCRNKTLTDYIKDFKNIMQE